MSVHDRLEVHEVRTLSADWYVLKKTRFSFRRSDGSWQEQWRETYDRGNGATILLYDLTRRQVVLTRQFRYPAFVNGHDDLLIETPAGLLDAAEPEARIRAEVEEETGFRLGPVRRVFEAYMSPGSVTEKLFFFVAPYALADRIGPGGGNAAQGVCVVDAADGAETPRGLRAHARVGVHEARPQERSGVEASCASGDDGASVVGVDGA